MRTWRSGLWWEWSWLRALPGGISSGAPILAVKWGYIEWDGKQWRSRTRISLPSKQAGWTVGGAFGVVKAGQLVLLSGLLIEERCSAWLDRRESYAKSCGILEIGANDFSRWKKIDLFGQDKAGKQVRAKARYKLLRSQRLIFGFRETKSYREYYRIFSSIYPPA